ncbi:GNAT family N-acetyltransferase [Occultella glacieicola]|uniref:GNAT family N-acetyltransferase n=1 Tax=Occultella glacieicola TaxID=2518684 RepID=A0ABY2E020_9MICO|nr:GNAT family N-acetyltransferase [Occultella glacieicola]TDE90753.1 GNAT family N-acetyltransferase [Occultella glacieicola]
MTSQNHAGHSHGLTADVSVRPSLAEDADTLGAIQVAAWRAAHAEVLPARVLDGLEPEVFAAAWGAAIKAPPTAKHRMLTACAGPEVVGFAALAPAPESTDTGEVVALYVDPAHLREGHGSRLLAACTDILGSTGASHVRTWVLHGDASREDFLSTAGFEPIGVRRVLEVAGTQVPEAAWTATL